MNRTEYLEAVSTLPAFTKQTIDWLSDFHKAHGEARDAYPAQEAEKWKDGKARRHERFTKAELVEIQDQAEQQLRQERETATHRLNAAVEIAREKATAVERFAETLRPEWEDLPAASGDYPRAMMRMAHEFAARLTRERLTDASFETWDRVYADAIERGDRIIQGVIEDAFGDTARPIVTPRPAMADVAALFRLQRSIRAQKLLRHPAELRALHEAIATVDNDKDWQRHQTLQLVLPDGARRRVA